MNKRTFKCLINTLAYYCWPVSLIMLCIITYLSLSPLTELPKVPGTDKLHHLVAYASLAIPIAVKGSSRWWLVLLFYLLWSAGIEFIQPWVNRYGELEDFFANAAGVILGGLIGVGLRALVNLDQNTNSK